jgi:hypothetical protein
MAGNSDPLLTKIGDIAAEREVLLPREAFQIVGVWNTEYAVRLRSGSSPLHLKHVCVQTNHIGTCYYETGMPSPRIDENLVGRHVLDEVWLPRFLRIAALDALFGNLVGSPHDDFSLNGSSADKALARAKIVCDEVFRIADSDFGGKPVVNVVNVGVVGDFIELLVSNSRLRVEATDFYDALVGKSIHGVRVKSGDPNTIRCIESADIALVTGMTLANETIDGIMYAARRHGTRVILFAETGSNFAEVYLNEGAAAVVAESFPFYLSGSDTCRVRVYRSDQS